MSVTIARYYIAIQTNQRTRKELSDPNSLLTFLLDNNNREGDLFVEDMEWLRIHYNVYTGRVQTIAEDDHSHVTSSFSLNALKPYVKPLLDVISLIAKIELLMALDELRDSKVSDYIHKRHDIGLSLLHKNLTLVEVDYTLYKIARLCHPLFGQLSSQKSAVQSAIDMVFSNLDLSAIRGLNDVDNIMSRIRNECKK